MSWLFSQALVEEYSVDICSDGELSVQSSGSPTQLAYCALDKMTKFSRLSRFGMTFKPLTENRGEELLMSYLEDFRARTLVLPEKEQESRENEAECGEKWHALLGKYDRNTRSWKTAQCSLFEDLELSLETWPRWGLMRDGECWEQQTLVQTTNEKESGLWLTPSTVDIPTRSAESMEKRLEYRKKIGRNGVTAGCLSEQVEWSGKGQPIGYITKETWPTPRSFSAMAATITPESAWNEKRKSNLETIVGQRFWPTPTSHMAKETNAPSEHKRNTPTLTAQVNWPTPTTRDYKGANGFETTQKKIEEGLRAHMGQLPNAIQHLEQKPIGGTLNPDWVEWLMNWPIKWSNLNEFNKQEFQRWQKTSAKAIQDIGQMRTMWWDSDPSQTPLGQQPFEQSTEQHCDSLPEMPRVTSCERKMERSQQGSNLSLLREDVYIQEVERKNLQSGMREQTGLDKTEIIPRVSQSIVARVDRLKAIGNGQVPLCAATAWRILTKPNNDDK